MRKGRPSLKIPSSSEEGERFLEEVVPKDARIGIRPMFGNTAAFVNGNLFAGLFGEDFFVKVPEGDRLELMRNEGAHSLEPMKGKPMKDYVVLPRAWRGQPKKVQPWVLRALDWVGRLPAKEKKK